MGAKNKANEIYLTRVYEAPVKMVWEAWTDPKKAANWWGPRGFTITTHSKDFKVGGIWHYTMHGPDGTDYPNKAVYLEIEKYSRMVYDHGGYDDRPPLFRVTVTFEEKNGKTKMEMTMALATPEAAKEIKKFIKLAGGDATWDRLAEYLAKDEPFVINRSFETDIKTMFEMWTKPEHYSRWLPPTGFDMKFIKAEIRVGGTSFYSMSNQDGVTMYGKTTYKEITPPKRIVNIQCFCDKEGNPTRHIFSPTWPTQMQATIDFFEESPTATRVRVTMEVFGDATPEEHKTFFEGKSGMTLGWTGSFDKLEDVVK